MIAYSGRPFSPVEAQTELMKSHVIRAAVRSPKSDTENHTPLLAKPPSWATPAAPCVPPAGLEAWEAKLHMNMWTETERMKPGAAAELCAGCPVMAQCRADAMVEEKGLSARNRYCVRGGLSPRERAALEVAERPCERGHVGRWGDEVSSNTVRCLECKAEDQRARYAEKIADPVFRERKNHKQRERRAERHVSCVRCKVEMRTQHFGRHIATMHTDEERAA